MKSYRHIGFAAAPLLATMLGFASVPATAMTASPIPAATEATPAVTLVSGGCGFRFHRTPFGYCRPNFYGRYYGYRGHYRGGWGWHHRGWRRGWY